MSWRKYIGAGPEEETPRDGALSSRAEWHATGLGLAVGFNVVSLSKSPLSDSSKG